MHRSARDGESEGARRAREEDEADRGRGLEPWRIVLLRGCVSGDVGEVARATTLGPTDAIHDRFTKGVSTAQLEETIINYFTCLNAGPLYVAAAHGHADVVEWLLDHGCDPALPAVSRAVAVAVAVAPSPSPSRRYRRRRQLH